MSRSSDITQVNGANINYMTYIEGVGLVPNRPRADRQQSENTEAVFIKEEEQEGRNTTQNLNYIQDVTDGVTDQQSSNNMTPEYDIDWNHNFTLMLARYNSDRSSSHSTAVRQNVSGHRSRETSNSFSHRRDNRQDTLSPRGGSDHRYTSGSPMFVSPGPKEQSLSRDSSISTHRDFSSSPEDELEDVVKNRCTCPVSYNCDHRQNNLLDCRPLVKEPMTWSERQDQEAFDRERMTEPLSGKNPPVEILRKVCTEVERFKNADNNRTRQSAIAGIRQWILDVLDSDIPEGPQRQCVTEQVLPCLHQFLGPGALRRRLPTYIEEELTVLLRKWQRGDFDGAVSRGLIVRQTFDVNGISIRSKIVVDPEWTHYVSALYFGEGELVNGQVWYSRVELQRDGVHAPPIAGISGTITHGARSIVLGAFDEKKNEGYADIDMGDTIEYVGTALPDQEGLGPTNEQDLHMNHPGAWDEAGELTPTIATRAMMRSYETGDPVRVIRSYKMCSIVKNKPKKGFRYDGLYRVTRKSALKEARQIWSFRLERLENQGPLRGFRKHEPQPDSRGHRKCHFYR